MKIWNKFKIPVELRGFPFERKIAETFGGVLCGKTYTFYQIRFYASDDPKLSSFSQIDGRGSDKNFLLKDKLFLQLFFRIKCSFSWHRSPLTLSVIYINEECRSEEECFHRRDGFVIENFLLDFVRYYCPNGIYLST